MNKQIFYNQYKRINSYFEGTELACSGLPTGRELELLEAVRDKVPPELFKKPYANPVNGNPEADPQQSTRGYPAVEGSRLRSAGSTTRQCQNRRTFFGRIACRRSELRARVLVLQTVARAFRHHRRGARRSTKRNTKIGCAIGISTSSHSPGANRSRLATNSAAIGVRRRRTNPAR